jgi:hypothetical protein
MVKGTSSMALAGPALVKAAVGEDITEQELGGSKVHNRDSGCADLEVPDVVFADLIEGRVLGVSRIPSVAPPLTVRRACLGSRWAPYGAPSRAPTEEAQNEHHPKEPAGSNGKLR